MKIWFITRCLTGGGAERQLGVLATALAARGHEVGIISLYDDAARADDLEDNGVTVHMLGKRGRWDLLSPLAKLFATVRRQRPDIIHGYLPVANVLAVLTGAVCRGTRVCMGLRASGMDLRRYDAVSALSYRVEALLSRFADLAIANADANLVAARARGLAGITGGVVANGINPVRFSPNNEHRTAWRQRLELEGRVVFGMIARRDPMKDHETFLRAARLMAERRHDLAFVLAGAGVCRDDDAIRSLADDVAAPVHLLGQCEHPETLYPALDVCVLSSAFGEGFPNALAEAMACGVPCVTTETGACADLVADTGEVVPPKDAPALAEACLRMTERFSELGPKARNRIERAYSVERLAEATEACLRPFVDRRPLVVHIITGLGRGGAEKSLAALVTSANSFRHEVVSLTDEGCWAEPLRKAGIPVHVLKMRGAVSLPGGMLRLWAMLRRSSPTLVQTWLYHADLAGTVAARLTGVPVIWSLRCSDMDSRYRWMTRLLARLSRWPAAIIANSEAGRSWHAGLGYNPRKWEVIPNGVDAALFRPDPDRRATWRARLGVDADTVLVGMAARRDPMKDHESFLRAAALLARGRDGLAFCIAGRGTDDDPILKQLAGSVGAPVHLVGERADMPGLLASLDIFVLASRFGEGFPNVVAEAMACGVACVATDVGDCAPLIGKTGVIVPPDDAQALADAIGSLAEDRALCRRLGIESRSRVELEFSPMRTTQRYEGVWNRAIG